MEFIPGITLEALLNRHQVLSLEQTCRLMVPLCRALTAGHALAITHRDLKPANLMVTDPDTPRETLKVMDFGLAQLNVKPHIPLDRLRGSDPGTAFGTPIYMAPDGLRGDPVDHRADIYSLGVILFELLTGVPPFNYADAATIMNAHVKERVPRFSEVRPGLAISLEIETIVQLCLEKYPYERPQSAKVIAEEFCRAAGMPLTADQYPEVNTAPEPLAKTEADICLPAQGKYTLVHKLDAWMPEPIAVVKLRGFVEDEHGEVLESKPGMIRVVLFHHSSPPRTPTRSMLSWLANRKNEERPAPPPDPIEMLLYLAHGSGAKANSLKLTIVFKPLDGANLNYPDSWQARCDKLFFELRGYLMAK